MRSLPVIILFIFSSAKAQNPVPKFADFEFNVNAGILKTLTSNMFANSFNGIYEGNAAFTVRAFGGFRIGAGYQLSSLENNKYIFLYSPVAGGAQLFYKTGMYAHAGFLRFMYQKQVSDIMYTGVSLNAGYMYGSYFNVIEDTSAANRPVSEKFFTAPYIQPEVTLNFYAEKNLSFSIFASYTTVFAHFDPRAPRLNQFAEVNERTNHYFMSWINFGFGANILIYRKKS